MKKIELSRRDFLKFTSSALLGSLFIGSTQGCSQQEPKLRIASNVFPGYEFIFLARAQNYYQQQPIHLIELPSATACIQSLAAGTVEGAMLTLDEVLTAKAEGLDLTVITVLDVSLGADVLMAKPEIKSLGELKGKRIGVEQSAVGAVMLDAVLKAAHLTNNDIKIEYMTVNQHRDAFANNKVDALISFEPVKTQLSAMGAIQLFDSSNIPGRIIDVLAVLPQVINRNPQALKTLVAGHFKARQLFLDNPELASKTLAHRLQLQPEEVPGVYVGMELSSSQQNLDWLSGSPAKLEKSAQELKQIMLDAKLLARDVSLANLATADFIPN